MTIIIIYHYLSFFPDIGPVTPDSGTPCVWDLMSKAKKKKKNTVLNTDMFNIDHQYHLTSI